MNLRKRPSRSFAHWLAGSPDSRRDYFPRALGISTLIKRFTPAAEPACLRFICRAYLVPPWGVRCALSGNLPFRAYLVNRTAPTNSPLGVLAGASCVLLRRKLLSVCVRQTTGRLPAASEYELGPRPGRRRPGRRRDAGSRRGQKPRRAQQRLLPLPG